MHYVLRDMKKNISIFAIILWSIACWTEMHGQAFPISALWGGDPYRINPAGGEGKGYWTLDAHTRSQWAAINGAPIDFGFELHGSVGRRSGVGLRYFQEQIGLEKRTILGGSYSYTSGTTVGRLTAALGAGASRWLLDGGKVRTPGGKYGATPDHKDDVLPATLYAKYNAFFQVGVALSSPIGKFGISFEKLGVTGWPLKAKGSYNPNGVCNVYWKNKYLVMQHFVVLPQVRWYSDGITFQEEISLGMEPLQNIFVAAALRVDRWSAIEGLVLSAGVKLRKGVVLYFAFDQSFGISRQYLINSSNEVSLIYTWGHEKGKGNRVPIIYNPVYL